MKLFELKSYPRSIMPQIHAKDLKDKYDFVKAKVSIKDMIPVQKERLQKEYEDAIIKVKNNCAKPIMLDKHGNTPKTLADKKGHKAVVKMFNAYSFENGVNVAVASPSKEGEKQADEGETADEGKVKGAKGAKGKGGKKGKEGVGGGAAEATVEAHADADGDTKMKKRSPSKKAKKIKEGK